MSRATKRAREDALSPVDAVQLVCMRKLSQEQIAALPSSLTPLDKQVVTLRQSLPSDVMLLVVCGYKVKFYGRDSRVANRRLGIMCIPTAPFESSSVPVVRLPHYLTRLTEMGYHVAVANQVETAALRATAATKPSSKVFERVITAVYSKSTTSSATFEALYQTSAGGGGGVPGNDAADDDEEDCPPTADDLPQTDAAADSSAPTPTPGASGGGAQASAQDATLHVAVFLAFDSENTLWELETVSFASFVRSGVTTVPPDRIVAAVSRVWLHLEPCEFIAAAHSIETVEKILHEAGILRLNRGPTDEGLEDDCDATLTTLSLPGRCHTVDLIHAFAERFLLRDCVDRLRVVPLHGESGHGQGRNAIASAAAFSSVHIPPTTLDALHVFRSDSRHHSSSSPSLCLMKFVDRCVTKAGSRVLRTWLAYPLCSDAEILRRQRGVLSLSRDSDIRKATDSLVAAAKGYLTDAEATLGRMQMGKATVREIIGLIQTLTRLKTVVGALPFLGQPTEASGNGGAPAEPEGVGCMATQLLERARCLSKSSLVDLAMQQVNMNARSVSDVFDDVAAVPPAIAALKDEQLKAETAMRNILDGIRKELRMPRIEYATVAGIEFLIDLPNTAAASVPSHWMVVSRTKSNVRYHTPLINDAASNLYAIRDKIQFAAEREWRAMQIALVTENWEAADATRELLATVGSLDALTSLAKLLELPGYVMPRVVRDARAIEIQQGRHPTLDVVMGGRYTAVDVDIAFHGSWIITGPNMGGKSALMRMVGLFCLLAHMGAPVPADSCVMPVFEAVFCRMGLEDAVLEQRSTFLNEMLETQQILTSPVLPRALVLMDELGQGTSSFDGLAVASATLEFLIRRGATTLFVTHHTALCDAYRAGITQPLVQCKYMAFIYDTDGESTVRSKIRFLHKPVDGVTPSSFGVEVAAMAGLPGCVIENAKRISALAQKKQAQREALHALAMFLHPSQELPS